MAHDENFTRFFCFLSLFAGAMLGVVIANSLLLLFICWEIVGLTSYPAHRLLVSQAERGGRGEEGVYHDTDWRPGIFDRHGVAVSADAAHCFSMTMARDVLSIPRLSRCWPR